MASRAGRTPPSRATQSTASRLHSSAPVSPSGERNGVRPIVSATGAMTARVQAARRRSPGSGTCRSDGIGQPDRRSLTGWLAGGDDMNLDRAGGSDRLVDHRAVQQLLTAGPSGCTQHQLVGILVAGEIQHSGRDIDAGQFGVVSAQFAQQSALAGQPCGLGLDQAAGLAARGRRSARRRSEWRSARLAAGRARPRESPVNATTTRWEATAADARLSAT